MDEQDKIMSLMVGPIDDPEISSILDQIRQLENKLFTITMRKRYNVDAQIISEDEISIDGVVYNGDEYFDWLVEHDEYLRKQLEQDEEEDDTIWGQA